MDEVEDHSEDSLQVAFRLGNSPSPPGALRHNKESDQKPSLAAMLQMLNFEQVVSWKTLIADYF